MPIDSPDAPVGAPLREAKQAMRLAMVAARDALDPTWRARASAELVERIASLPTFARARSVLLTAPFRSEWDAAPLIERALAHGKDVSLPRVNEPERMLEICRIEDPATDIVPGHRGIPEPSGRCIEIVPASIDWVLVPGIAFDPTGARLGYGGGYYDRLLPILAADAARVAGAFSVQIVARVPSAPHDIRMDTVVSEVGVVVDRSCVR
ncbi:MAG: 5-formyltetrahydrofolate cyclo-ligase [Burkholderiales bacterium]|nr:5-formyltetrahydrofolate cyclo-ligase [Burkholderiales bacterium]MCE7876309.1 5-formyltetrahydrofolate cyclo-ligase [Betaproteobacteria bacterium PRO3]